MLQLLFQGEDFVEETSERLLLLLLFLIRGFSQERRELRRLGEEGEILEIRDHLLLFSTHIYDFETRLLLGRCSKVDTEFLVSSW